MFISALELFKLGIGPSSSHTMGPMVAAGLFLDDIEPYFSGAADGLSIRCTLKGSLAYTGHGHGTDKAIALGLHGFSPRQVAGEDIDNLVARLWKLSGITVKSTASIGFSPQTDVVFDRGTALPEHPNGMIFDLLDSNNSVVVTQRYFSIGGGFVKSLDEISDIIAPIKILPLEACQYGFDSAQSMLSMSEDKGMTIAEMKIENELCYMSKPELDSGLDSIWRSMKLCVENGLKHTGLLPGGLNIERRARKLNQQLISEPKEVTLNDWLCAYAMSVNEENAAGHMVVTAPTNGAAGVIPAVLYYFIKHENGSQAQVRDFLLVASAIGGLIKHNSSISGAEVGCQGEVGSAAAMAAAGLCAVKGGSTQQIENAAEIALEHHLGMTCDPVKGLVQVPCIERNGFGAIKAYTAASLALKGDGVHFMPLDQCIEAMRQTGMEMSVKYKETSLGGLAVSNTEC